MVGKQTANKGFEHVPRVVECGEGVVRKGLRAETGQGFPGSTQGTPAATAAGGCAHNCLNGFAVLEFKGCPLRRTCQTQQLHTSSSQATAWQLVTPAVSPPPAPPSLPNVQAGSQPDTQAGRRRCSGWK